MKRLFQMFGCLVIALAVTVAVFWPHRVEWPEFEEATTSAPQVVVEVEPDYAWRTGDRITLTIFIKQQPGTTVETNTLALEGDFEIASEADIYARDFKDGSRLYRVRFDVQSFIAKRKLESRANMAYLVGESNEAKVISLPAIELYTSYTWDGREDIKDGVLEPVHGNHLWYAGACLLVGLIGVVLTYRYIRRNMNGAETEEEPVVLRPRQVARIEFDRVWPLIESGDEDIEHYKSVERVLRGLYGIESRTKPEITFEMGDNHPHLKYVIRIMRFTNRVIYAHMPLSVDDKRRLKEAFDTICRPSYNPDYKGDSN